MARIIFSGTNHIPTATLSGGIWRSLLPVSNVKSRPISNVARTQDATALSSFLEFDHGENKTAQMVSVLNHNMILPSSRIRIRLSNDQGATTNLLYDSGELVVVPAIFDWLTNNFYNKNWFYGELPVEEQRAFRSQFLHIMPSAIWHRYGRIDFIDTSNADGYIQAGYVWVGPIYRPSVDVQLGSALSMIDNTAVQESKGGVEYFDDLRKPRVYTATVRGLTKDEMLANLFTMARLRGKGGLIYVIPDPDDTLNTTKEAMLARLMDMPSFPHFAHGNHYETTLGFKEII